MPWADAARALVELIPPILEPVFHCIAASPGGEKVLKSEPPPLESDCDDWKCPDASQITRALGTGTKTHRRRGYFD